MTPLVLSIDVINPALHAQEFVYVGDVGPGRLKEILPRFQHIAEWRDYLLTLQIRSVKVPTIHADTYHAALRMMLLAWVEPAVIKPAELQALRSLEAALIGSYYEAAFAFTKEKKPKLKREKFKCGLSTLLDYAAERDQLDATLHSASKKESGSALSVIRNVLAHGNLFNSLPWGGLFEAVKAVMGHAYRTSSIDTTVLMPSYFPPEPPSFGLL
ncbi:MAG: hypothetical protein HKL99_08510 [Burkholderiales bacterium]|nr:hypothetical protein [Burkholderiales bacterium]